jgi:hypothetical protein
MEKEKKREAEDERGEEERGKKKGKEKKNMEWNGNEKTRVIYRKKFRIYRDDDEEDGGDSNNNNNNNDSNNNDNNNNHSNNSNGNSDEHEKEKEKEMRKEREDVREKVGVQLERGSSKNSGNGGKQFFIPIIIQQYLFARSNPPQQLFLTQTNPQHPLPIFSPCLAHGTNRVFVNSINESSFLTRMKARLKALSRDLRKSAVRGTSV